MTKEEVAKRLNIFFPPQTGKKNNKQEELIQAKIELADICKEHIEYWKSAMGNLIGFNFNPEMTFTTKNKIAELIDKIKQLEQV